MERTKLAGDFLPWRLRQKYAKKSDFVYLRKNT